MTERVAFVQTSALGDVILATAVAREYKRQHPECELTWFVFDQYAEAVRGLPYVDHVFAWMLVDDVPRQYQEPDQWNLMMRWCHENYGKVVVPQIYPFNMPWDRAQLHMIEQQAVNAGLSKLADRSLDFPTANQNPCRGPYVAANSRSNTQSPVWTTEMWRELDSILSTRDVILIDGDAGGNDLSDWHDTIAAASCYIGLDSGGTWLAATTDTPQICLYNEHPTCPRWLTGLKASKVKADHLCHEMTAPTPEQVAAKVLEIIR